MVDLHGSPVGDYILERNEQNQDQDQSINILTAISQQSPHLPYHLLSNCEIETPLVIIVPTKKVNPPDNSSQAGDHLRLDEMGTFVL